MEGALRGGLAEGEVIGRIRTFPKARGTMGEIHGISQITVPPSISKVQEKEGSHAYKIIQERERVEEKARVRGW